MASNVSFSDSFVLFASFVVKWAFIQDLKWRGMLDDTIILWTTEFGRIQINAKTATTKSMKSTKMEFDELSKRVIGCAIEVHRHLGPGLLTYMKLAGVKIGLLMNFNVIKLKDGIKRFVL